MLKLNGYEVILASGSPRRKAFFEQLGIPFKIQVYPVDESFPPHLKGIEIPEHIIIKKSQPFKKRIFPKQIFVIADTIVWCEDQYLGKPNDIEKAKEMLRFLSGKSHQVITSVGFLTHNKFDIISEVTSVQFRELTTNEIEHYVSIQPPLDKAGAYGIQDWIGEIGIIKIVGSYTNVVGLPLSQVGERIKLLTQK
jgi:septum formation protein